jgi:hypothetical protein
MFWNDLKKISKGRPIHKKEGKEEISNYRSISICQLKKFLKY